MRIWLGVTAALAALAGAADAALQSRTMDAVRTEVEVRRAAFPADPDKTQKAQLRTLTDALRIFDRTSTSRRTDAERVHVIVRKLDRALADDAAFQTVLSNGLLGFVAEMRADMARAARGLGALDGANRRRAGAQRAVDRANAALDLASAALGALPAELDHVRCASLCRKAALLVLDSGATMTRALKIDTTLTPHEDAFLRVFPNGFTNADECISCHVESGTEMLATRHWKWEEPIDDDPGVAGQTHGKTDIINNFCIAIPSNEPRCTQCHAGIGWKNTAFDFTATAAIDCLACHDTTGTYKKDLKTAGAPMPTVDVQAVALAIGKPNRTNCGNCHWFAGGGDNVKTGDMASSLANPTSALDVHMGTDTANMTCQDCHSGPATAAKSDRHAGLETGKTCIDCHGSAPHVSSTLDDHTARVACETCHIPAYSRGLPTKIDWDWSTAGQNVSPIPVDQYGKPTYDKMKGTFQWGKSVRPELRWFNGQQRRTYIGVNDVWTSLPVVLSQPVGSRGDPAAKLHPFKKMVGKQPADAVNRTILVPHLFGTGPGPNPYWGVYDWNKALQEGAAYAGQTYSGQFEFVATQMFLPLHHEIAPKTEALGCTSCHQGGIDWVSLGYAGDPLLVQ